MFVNARGGHSERSLVSACFGCFLATEGLAILTPFPLYLIVFSSDGLK